MKEEILNNLNNPARLEKLYRSNKDAFRQSFADLYSQLKDHHLAVFWNARLNYPKEEITKAPGMPVLMVLLLGLLAGTVAKLPMMLNIDEEFFYPRNLGFIVFPFLAAFFAWKNRLPVLKIILVAGIMLLSAVFINALPLSVTSDTLILSCIHLVLFLWFATGMAFTGNMQDVNKRLHYLKFNGDLLIMTGLIAIAGGILTAITIGLFQLIGFNIEEFYFQNIVVFLLPAAPILASWLIQTNAQLVGRISPVIARIFSPLVLVMLVTYLVAMIWSAKDPYNDREFLLIFNALLIGVMAIIFFSVAESSGRTKTEVWILLLLSLVTIVVNGIALSAIMFRISEWGITPNRIAVLGGNILILLNLVLVTWKLFRVVSGLSEIDSVRNITGRYLPVYFAWVGIVTFFFPFIFGFK